MLKVFSEAMKPRKKVQEAKDLLEVNRVCDSGQVVDAGRNTERLIYEEIELLLSPLQLLRHQGIQVTDGAIEAVTS